VRQFGASPKWGNFAINHKACPSVAQSAERVAVAIAASTGNLGWKTGWIQGSLPFAGGGEW